MHIIRVCGRRKRAEGDELEEDVASAFGLWCGSIRVREIVLVDLDNGARHIVAHSIVCSTCQHGVTDVEFGLLHKIHCAFSFLGDNRVSVKKVRSCCHRTFV